MGKPINIKKITDGKLDICMQRMKLDLDLTLGADAKLRAMKEFGLVALYESVACVRAEL